MSIDPVRLGESGLHVSRLGLGMMSYGDESGSGWALDERDAEPVVRRAIEVGFTFFDTADMYWHGGSETVTGRLVRKLINREECVVATKVYYPTTPGPNGRGGSRKHVLAAIDASLKRLGMDHVDLCQIHRFDPETPVEETMEALHDVVRAGKAGTSGRARCSRGSSARRSTSPRSAAGRGSCRCRTATTCSTARMSAR